MRLFVLLMFLASSVEGQRLVSYFKPKVKGIVYNTIRHTTDIDGNILLIGTIDHLEGVYSGSILKLDSNGRLVEGFHKVITDNPIYNVLSLPENKILINGPFSKINGVPTKNLVRLNPDGTIDGTFDCEVSGITHLAIQSDGKIIVLGNLAYMGYNYVARLNSNGTLDQTFNNNIPYDYPSLISISPDNSIFISDRNSVKKLDPDGHLDNNFSTGLSTEMTGSLSDIAVTSIGKVLIGGSFSKYNGVACNNIALLDTDGGVNLDFKINLGVGPQGQIHDIHIRTNNNILIGGQFIQFNNQPGSLVELSPGGNFIRVVANVSSNNIQSIGESSDQRISIAGGFTSVNGLTKRNMVVFNPNYTIVNSFNPDLSETSIDLRFFMVDSDENMYTGGGFQFLGIYDGFTPIYSTIVKVDQLGNYNENFQTQTPQWASIWRAEIQADGKLLVASVILPEKISRLNPDGSIDNSFFVGSGPKFNGQNSSVSGIKYRGSTIYVSGQMDVFNGVNTSGIVALNLNGSVQKAFTSLPNDTYIEAFDFQSNGKIIIAGNIPFPGGLKKIIRLNGDGTIDNSFTNNEVVGNFSFVRVDENNNIYLGGSFYSFGGALVNSALRLLPNGTLDASFNTGIGFTDFNNVSALEFLPNGNIVIGGSFRKYNSQTVHGFVVVDQTGQLVPTPGVQFGSRTHITNMKYAGNALYVSGRLCDLDQTEVFGVGKISFSVEAAPTAPDQLAVSLESPGNFNITWVDNSNNEVGFVLERSLSETSGFEQLITLEANSFSFTDYSIADNITYFYRIRAVNDGGDSEYSNVNSQIWIIPNAPSDLSVTQHVYNELKLSWTDNSTNEDGFLIERSVDNSSNFIQIQVTPSDVTEYTDVVQSNTLYFYRLSSYSEAGGPSAFSNSVSITSFYLPNPPSNLTVQQIGATKLTLAWVDNSDNEDGFVVERSIGSSANFSILGTVGVNVKSFSDTDILEQKEYFYRVYAFHYAGQSGNSNIATITSLYPPTAPDQLVVKQTKINEVTLTWRDNSENEDGFKIEKSTDGVSFAEAGQAIANAITFKDPVGPPDSFYIYRLKSFNLVGESAYSETAQLDVILGADDAIYNLVVFPNPVSEFLYINETTKSSEDGNWNLINVLGQKQYLQYTIAEEYYVIDVRNVPNGLYLLQKSNTNTKPIKVLISK